MRLAIAITSGLVLTALLLWMVLGGVNVWRHAAFSDRPAAPDAGVRVRFYKAPK